MTTDMQQTSGTLKIDLEHLINGLYQALKWGELTSEVTRSSGGHAVTNVFGRLVNAIVRHPEQTPEDPEAWMRVKYFAEDLAKVGVGQSGLTRVVVDIIGNYQVTIEWSQSSSIYGETRLKWTYFFGSGDCTVEWNFSEQAREDRDKERLAGIVGGYWHRM